MNTAHLANWFDHSTPHRAALPLPYLTRAFINRLRRPSGVGLVAYTDIDVVYLWEEHPDGTEKEVPWPEGWPDKVSEYWLKAHGFDDE